MLVRHDGIKCIAVLIDTPCNGYGDIFICPFSNSICCMRSYVSCKYYAGNCINLIKDLTAHAFSSGSYQSGKLGIIPLAVAVYAVQNIVSHVFSSFYHGVISGFSCFIIVARNKKTFVAHTAETKIESFIILFFISKNLAGDVFMIIRKKGKKIRYMQVILITLIICGDELVSYYHFIK